MSDFSFNEILERREVDLKTCRIVRHDTRALREWRHSRACLESFFSYQRTGNRTPYRGATVVFQFVPVGSSYALFVGAYRILGEWQFPTFSRQPILHDPEFGENDDHEHLRYDLERVPEFEDLVGKLLIDWGTGTRAWSQWPARQDKPIIEIRAQRQDDPFPGFSEFQSTVEEIEFLPESWQGALSSVGGVYLLVCPNTGEQYVGSAYGEDGFIGRWRAYASNGHGGNQLLMARQRANYSVSIIEVASPDMSASDIIHREAAWKNKLGSRSHGLNAN
ncbi:GIY-YIG nuclease family protein [Shimia thalassica]|uniref:GIY-YIG nuclease family protein n=1 Tax=Shimia thalassica TaxID=1715693 RepID=UPI0026E3956B|nr:GIY-YIG nuclease family protein [Shimia thalassica]MDO6477984.1 GIY-YIG nuclease family protein [Shimia thalassica]MDO6522147.1 GIY-YIG nuclease family protein [Shimia thalassica]MDP2518957.1 GIY-YIG nuclease family protein [Shimia thalassica]